MTKLLDACLDIVLAVTVLLSPLLLQTFDRRYIPPIIVGATSALGLWVLKGLASGRLRYLKTPMNLCLWSVFVISAFHVLPLPASPSGGMYALADWFEHFDAPSLLAAPVRAAHGLAQTTQWFRPFGLNAASAQWAFLIVASMVSLCFVIGHGVNGRLRLRRLTWAAIAMAVLAGLLSIIGTGSDNTGGQASHFARTALLVGPPGASLPLLLTGLSLALGLLLRLTLMAPTSPGQHAGLRLRHLLRRSGAQGAGLVLAVVFLAVCLALVAGKQLNMSAALVLFTVAITVLAVVAVALYTRKVRKHRRRLAVLVIGCASIIAVIALLGAWHAPPGTPRSRFGVRGAGPADGASLDIQT
ncbi:MAG: hypothetical protein QGD94_06080, partial [Planctomycetia bacterium]|nr:hypothetical protein [Planctomycetia bacterium]